MFFKKESFKLDLKEDKVGADLRDIGDLYHYVEAAKDSNRLA